jgi:hypothetical protein
LLHLQNKRRKEMSIEAMHLALEALLEWKEYAPHGWDTWDEEAITALRTAIEKLETAEFHSAEYWKGHDDAVCGVAKRWEEALTDKIPKAGVMNEPIESLYRRTEALRTAIEEAEKQEPVAWVNAVMEQAQVFASAWSLVGSRFDDGSAIEDAEDSKAELRSMLTTPPYVATPLAAPVQEPVAWLIWLHGPAGLFENKQFAEHEFARRNQEYPDKDRKLRPLIFGDTTPPAATVQEHEPENEPFVSLASVQSAERVEPVAWMWHQAPVKTQWGHNMVVADLAIDKDHTVSIYCEKDQTAKVEAIFTPPNVATPLAAQPAPVQEPSPGGILFAVEQAIRNGDCPWEIESAFDAYETERKALAGITEQKP